MADKPDAGQPLEQALGGRSAVVLLTVIDFFSRWIVAYDVVQTVHAGSVKAIYKAGLNNQGISLHSQSSPSSADRARQIHRK